MVIPMTSLENNQAIPHESFLWSLIQRCASTRSQSLALHRKGRYRGGHPGVANGRGWMRWGKDFLQNNLRVKMIWTTKSWIQSAKLRIWWTRLPGDWTTKKRNLPTTNMVDWEHVRSSWLVISRISKTFLLLFLMGDDTVGNPTTNLPCVSICGRFIAPIKMLILGMVYLWVYYITIITITSQWNQLVCRDGLKPST